jgi:outer membrane protein assembly factor BamB
MSARFPLIVFLTAALGIVRSGVAQDWPQWRGPNRDARAEGFSGPKEWPKELTKKWSVTVGLSDSTPALVGDKLYVFARQEGKEVISCLDAATGKEIWKDGYDALAATGPAGRHPGPRSSPVVADGKIVTYGVRGKLSCLDASSGKVFWRKDDPAGTTPRFFTASSPVLGDGLCIAQMGSEDKGGVYAYSLSDGEEKWKWTDEGTGYSSPMIFSVDGTRQVVAMTSRKVVGLALADGKLSWELPFAPQGRAYNAATPILRGTTVIYTGAGRGTRAAQISKQADAFAAKELWTNATHSVQFNTPVLKDNLIYGIAQNGDMFCIKSQDGSTAWTAPAPAARSGFGTIIDAGSALVVVTPQTQTELMVFAPGDSGLKKLASYKVADTEVYASPVLSKNRIYIKDLDSVTLWTME